MNDPLFINSAGSVVPVPSEQVEEATGMGWVPASPKQVQDFQLQAKYGDQAGLAALESAGSALTFGLSSVAERHLGVPAEDIKGREEANPWASGLGTAAGIAAPLVTGLPGAAKLIASAGKATARLTAGLLPTGESVLGRIAARAASMGAGSAIEGAAYGAGQVVHESALGDPKLTAESALAHVGLSAVLGGGLGAAMGVGEVALPALLGKARDAVQNVYRRAESLLPKAEAVTGTPADVTTLMLEHKQQIAGFEQHVPGVTEDLAVAQHGTAKWMIDNQARLTEAEKAFPGFTRTLSQASPDTAQFILDNWQAVRRDPAALNALKESQRTSLQQVYGDVENALRVANKEIRPAESAKYLEGPHSSIAGDALEWVDKDQALNMAGRVSANVARAADAMKAEPELYASGYAKSLDGILAGLKRDVTAEAGPEALFGRLKTLKQQIDELIPYGKDTLGMGLSERNAIKELKGLRANIKDALRDESVWGSAGVRQAAFDDAQNAYFTARKEFQKRFMIKGADRAGRVTHQVDAVKVNGWFNSMADDRGMTRTRALDEYMATSRNLLDEIEKSHSAAPVSNFDRQALESVLNKSGEVTADARQSQTATELYKHLQGVQILGSGPVAPEPLAMRAVGMVAPGYITSTIKATMNAAKQVTSVPKAVATLAALERMGNSVARHIDSAASALVKGGRVADVARAEVEDSVATFKQRTEQVQHLANNPAAMHEVLTQNAIEHAPNTSQELQTASARAVGFLASKVPVHPKQGPLDPEWVPTSSEIDKFNRYYDAAEKPHALLGDAANGLITPEAVETVTVLYPALMQHMRGAVVGKMGPGVPYRARFGLSLLLGQPVDGAFTSPALMSTQGIFAHPAPSPARPPSGAKMTASHQSMTDLQRSGSR